MKLAISKVVISMRLKHTSRFIFRLMLFLLLSDGLLVFGEYFGQVLSRNYVNVNSVFIFVFYLLGINRFIQLLSFSQTFECHFSPAY